MTPKTLLTAATKTWAPMAALSVACLLNSSPCHAQARPAFEVASIRQHVFDGAPGRHAVGVSISGPRVTLSAMSVLALIDYAYDVKPYQVSGGPSWVHSYSDAFDIAARVDGEGAPTHDQVRTMVQTLLADRFQMKLHRETREVPVYALVLAKNGPKLKESAPDAVSRANLRSGAGAVVSITVTKGSMTQLADQLANNSGVDRPVLDQTGLTGRYDYELKWLGDRTAPGASPSASDSDVPSIFTALQEQLGLKLEPRRAPVEVLVIDHADRPSEN